MSLWAWIVLASIAAYALKLSGYLVPPRWLENPRMIRMAGTVTIGLLASLTVMNAFSIGPSLMIDARAGALLAAAVALLLRWPFLLVVTAGAAAAALIRMTGFG